MVLSVVIGSLACAAVGGDGEFARDVDFDAGWTFERVGHPESRTVVDLPHDYQINLPWVTNASPRRAFKEDAEAWYRKSFAVDPSWRGDRVLLDFEGVMSYGDIYVNGKKLFESKLSYLGFEVDITESLRWEGTNEVAVWTSTGPKSESAWSFSRWYTGGGIYRSVRLVRRPHRSFARHGLYVRADGVSADSAQLKIQAQLEGFKCETNRVTVQARILSPDGEEVARAAGRLRMDTMTRPEVDLEPVTLAKPHLWKLDDPALYVCEAEVLLNDRVCDRIRTSFGVRTLAWSKDTGFSLNGRRTFLIGVANHHDLGCLGAAAHRRAIRRYVKTLKTWGYNCIRCSHNPYSVSLLEECDRQGLVVVDEFTDKWNDVTGANTGSRVPFREVFADGIREWVRRDRNHPCVILWSLGNELQVWDETAGFATDDCGVTTYRVLDLLVKRWDATRPTTVALYPSAENALLWNDPRNRVDPHPPRLLCASEVASQNYRPEWFDVYRRKCPSLILFQSEAATADLLGPAFQMNPEKSVGLAWWGVMEYWGESNGWPKKGWNYSYFAHTLEPYPQAWLIRSWAKPDEPVCKIGVKVGPTVREIWNDVAVGQTRMLSSWNLPDGAYDVTVYSNGDEAELSLNGSSLGRKPVTKDGSVAHGSAVWSKVRYANGTLSARAWRKGLPIAADEIRTAGEVRSLAVEAENGDDFKADGHDLLYLNVRAVDAKGVFAPTACNAVRVEVSGAATLLATDSGNHYTDERFDVAEKKLYRGTLQIILRATREPGEVKVRIVSSGLPDVEYATSTQGM